MLKEDLIKKNPLRVLNPLSSESLPDHRMGLVMARAGLGKTAILVQIAMDSLLRGKKVLHVSVGEGLEKVKAWYEDIFKYIAEGQQLENAGEIEDELMRGRIIMTFKEAAFSRLKLVCSKPESLCKRTKSRQNWRSRDDCHCAGVDTYVPGTERDHR